MKTPLACCLLLLAASACSDPAGDAPKAVTEPASASSAKPSGSSGAAESPRGGPLEVPAKPDGALALGPETSSVEFVGAKVTGRHEGKFERFSGWVSVPDGKITAGRVVVEIEVASAKTDSEKLDKHLRSDHFFDADKHPKATFVSRSIEESSADGATHTVRGSLSLRGVVREISFPAKISASGGEVTAEARFSINRKDFDVSYPGKVDDLIRDDVLLTLKIVAKR